MPLTLRKEIQLSRQQRERLLDMVKELSVVDGGTDNQDWIAGFLQCKQWVLQVIDENVESVEAPKPISPGAIRLETLEECAAYIEKTFGTKGQLANEIRALKKAAT